jgi:hypothetical protein
MAVQQKLEERSQARKVCTIGFVSLDLKCRDLPKDRAGRIEGELRSP